MTQSLFKQGRSNPFPLPGLPKPPMTPTQQLEALSRVQAQAEQRVHLGVQLFKAAEAQTVQHKQVLDDLKARQTVFRDEIAEDVARSFHAYDAWIGQVDSDLTDSIKSLEDKIARLQQDWQGTQARIEGMVQRSEKLLGQTRELMENGRFVPGARPGAAAMAAQTPSLAESAPATNEVAAVPVNDQPADPPTPQAVAAAPPSQPGENLTTPTPVAPNQPTLPPNFYTQLIDRLNHQPSE